MRFNRKFLSIILLILSSSLIAAENSAPIHIVADTVELDEKTGTSSYSGNVKLTQANLAIDADKISVFTSKKNLQKIIAVGKPATFTQIYTEKNLPPVTAQAKKIDYDAVNNSLTLFDDVQLKQGENTFTGDTIFYDIENNVMKAQGNEQTGRVQATIQLDSIKR